MTPQNKTLLEKYAEAKKGQLAAELKNCFLWSIVVLFMFAGMAYWFETGKTSLGIIWAIMAGLELLYVIISFIAVHHEKQEYIKECEDRLKQLEEAIRASEAQVKNND